jgi:putative phosphoesterase
VRLALISDQHGNDVALRAVLGDIERIGQIEDGIDEIVCLGDVAEGGCEPVQTLDRLRALNCTTILGNADAFLLEVNDSPEPTPERALEVREWTLSQLTEAHLEFIRSFQPVASIQRDGTSMLFFHGSPKSYDDLLIPEFANASLEPFRGYDVDLLAGGHTHKQWTRRIDGALFVNPGSVGLAYDHHQKEDSFKLRPVAEYALVILDALGLAVEFRQVPYPASEVQLAAVANGHPHAGEWANQWAKE